MHARVVGVLDASMLFIPVFSRGQQCTAQKGKQRKKEKERKKERKKNPREKKKEKKKKKQRSGMLSAEHDNFCFNIKARMFLFSSSKNDIFQTRSTVTPVRSVNELGL